MYRAGSCPTFSLPLLFLAQKIPRLKNSKVGKGKEGEGEKRNRRKGGETKLEQPGPVCKRGRWRRQSRRSRRGKKLKQARLVQLSLLRCFKPSPSPGSPNGKTPLGFATPPPFPPQASKCGTPPLHFFPCPTSKNFFPPPHSFIFAFPSLSLSLGPADRPAKAFAAPGDVSFLHRR